MLDQVTKHGNFDLKVIAEGDLEIDAHHTVEDMRITLGQAVNSALGEKKYKSQDLATLMFHSTKPFLV